MITDMTEGKPSTVLLKFSLPILLSVAFQQLYNIVDSIIAGNFVSDSALGAIGASYPVTMIFIAIATGGSSGASVVIARLFGSKDYKSTKTAINTTLVVFTITALVLTIIGVITGRPSLELLGTPEDIFPDSESYLIIYVLGLTFLFLYNACNACFTALGDSKTPLILLIISSIGNIILDLVFVIVFHLGVAGVAWATFVAQGASSILSLVLLLKKLTSLKSEKPKLFDIDSLGMIAKISLPSILQSSFVSVGNLFIQSLVNSFGSSDIIGGYASAIKLNTFALTCFSTVSGSISAFSAQNLGAEKYERVKQGVKAAFKTSLILSLPFVFAYTVFGGMLINLFAHDASPDIIETGRIFMLITAPFYPIICLKITADGVLKGCAIMTPFIVATCLDLVLRVGFAYILAPIFGPTGIWMSWPVGWTLAMVVSMLCYRYYIVKDRFKNR